MSRKVTKSLQRKLSPDRKYQSILVQRLINKSMFNGKKQVAEMQEKLNKTDEDEQLITLPNNDD